MYVVLAKIQSLNTDAMNPFSYLYKAVVILFNLGSLQLHLLPEAPCACPGSRQNVISFLVHNAFTVHLQMVNYSGHG